MKKSRLFLLLIIIVISSTVVIAFLLNSLLRKESSTPSFYTEQETRLVARTNQMHIEVFHEGEWKEHFIKGVNLGMAEPGKWFNDTPANAQAYLEWFEDIGKMNANTIRVYTLLDPYFYRALDVYNKNNPDQPLWLLQEIWPEEHPEGDNYLTSGYQQDYKKEIEYVVDAIHGNANVPERVGRAFGIYTADVSSYVLGYLVGRELEPQEVVSTNENNPGYAFKGDYVSGSNASPTEHWLAWSCDYVLNYEESSYGWQHPVAIVSWPTLDPIEHDSEWNEDGDKSKEYNDRVSIDVNNHFILGSKMKAGLFGAYHIYPNYPDFMNNEKKYDDYSDDQGRFRYGGYLQEFIAAHDNFPALIAEFGLATGMGNAHTSPDGYNHGGLTEQEQGEGIVRMMKTIRKEGYIGGVIFEWMDEWAKKTWITEPFMIPYERHIFWHNVIDPEQNYGIMALEAIRPDDPHYTLNGDGLIKNMALRSNEAYLYIDFTLEKEVNLEKHPLYVGLDTYGRDIGEFLYPLETPITAPSGMEFMLELSSKETSRLLVAPSYNITNYNFASKRSEDGKFEEIKRLINKERTTKSGDYIPTEFEESSKLRYGNFEESHNHWYVSENQIHIRIPWNRMNVTDPSSGLVLHDERSFSEYPERDGFQPVKTEGVIVTAALSAEGNSFELFPGGDRLVLPEPFSWKLWEEPLYQKRLKKSYGIIQDYLGQID